MRVRKISGKMLAAGLAVAGTAMLLPAGASATVVTMNGLTQKNAFVGGNADISGTVRTSDQTTTFGSRIANGNGIDYTGTTQDNGRTSIGTITFDEGNGWTPNVVLGWQPRFETYTDWDGRGNEMQIDFEDQNVANPPAPVTTLTLTFTPDAGYGVRVNSFDMDEWGNGGGDTSVSWAVLNGGSTLASGTWDAFDNANDPGDQGGQTPISTNLNDFVTGPTQLQFTWNSGSLGGYIGMDNLNFDQAVTTPEPASLALLGLGGLTLLSRKRRDKKTA